LFTELKVFEAAKISVAVANETDVADLTRFGRTLDQPTLWFST
jgi:hypothetical protein